MKNKVIKGNSSHFFLTTFFLLGIFLFPTPSHGQGFFAPSQPLNVTAVPGDGQAIVSFYPPANDGGTPVTGYIISGPSPLASKTAPGTVNSYTMNGLTNGTSYTFSVAAQNAAGTGPAASSNAVTPTAGSTTLNASASINFDLTDTSATVTGQVTGLTAADIKNNIIAFAYGLTINYELPAEYPTVDSQNNYTFTLKNLKPSTTYNYNLVMTGVKSVDLAGPATFTTTATPTNNNNGGNNNGTNTPPGTGSSSELSKYLQIPNPIKGSGDLPTFFANVLDGMVLVLTPILVVMFLYACFMFVTARGNTEKLGEAKQALMYTLIGIAIVLGAKGIAAIIGHTVGALTG